jgi:hypothetical protein
MLAGKLALAAVSLALLGLVSLVTVSVDALSAEDTVTQIFNDGDLSKDDITNLLMNVHDKSAEIKRAGKVTVDDLLSVVWTKDGDEKTFDDIMRQCLVDNYLRIQEIAGKLGGTMGLGAYVKYHRRNMRDDCIAYQRPILDRLIYESGVRALIVAKVGMLELRLGVQNDLRESAEFAWAGLEAKTKEKKQEETEQGKKTKQVEEIKEELKAACRRLFDRMEGRILERQFVEQDQSVVFCEIALEEKAPAMKPIKKLSK